MRHRKILTAVESLEPLVLLSSARAVPIPHNGEHPIEVWKRATRSQDGPTDTSTARLAAAQVVGVSTTKDVTRTGRTGATMRGVGESAISEARPRFARVREHGFIGGAAGVRRLQPYAPKEAVSRAQLNQPLGQARADRIARALRLDKNECFTEAQFLAFITGNGQNGSGNVQSAQLVDESIAILTNTNVNPLIRNVNGTPTPIVLGSYGLTVNTDGLLESPANVDAPTRQVNSVLAPGGYLSTWAAANGAEASLQMLYKSAYSDQLPFAIASQHEGGPAELALYLNGRKSAVTGLPMVPPIWEVNFALIYVLSPKLAARMPAFWAPIPPTVVAALLKSPTGQVPFRDYASYFGGSPRRRV